MIWDDPYATVREARSEYGYTGDDCDKCPGKNDCVKIYDIRCGYRMKGDEVFPCGQVVRKMIGLPPGILDLRGKRAR